MPPPSLDQTNRITAATSECTDRLEGKGLTTAFGARACRHERLDQTHQLPPRSSQFHLVEKHSLARALGDKLESAAGKADLLHLHSNSFRQCHFQGFAKVPKHPYLAYAIALLRVNSDGNVY